MPPGPRSSERRARPTALSGPDGPSAGCHGKRVQDRLQLVDGLEVEPQAVIVAVTVSVAVSVREPVVLSVAENVWAPLSPPTKV